MSGGSLNPFKPGSIYEKIGQGVGHTVENIGKDPLPIIMAIAITAITAGAGVGLAAAELMGAEGLTMVGGALTAQAGSAAAMISAGVNVGIANAAVAAINGGNIGQIATAGIIGGLTAGATAGLSGGDLLKAVTDGLPKETALMITSATGKSLTGAIGAIIQGRDPITGAVSGAVSGALSSALSSDMLADINKSAASVLGNAAGAGTAAALGGKDVAAAIGNSAVYGTLRSGLSAAFNSFNSLKDDFSKLKDSSVATINDLVSKSQELLPTVEEQQAVAKETYDKLMQYSEQYNTAKANNDADGMTAAAEAFNALKPTYDQQYATFTENNTKLNDWTNQINETQSALVAKHDELQAADEQLKTTFGDFTTKSAELAQEQRQIDSQIAYLPKEDQQKYEDLISKGADGQTAADAVVKDYAARKEEADAIVAELPPDAQKNYQSALLSGKDPMAAAEQSQTGFFNTILTALSGTANAAEPTTAAEAKPIQAIYLNGNTVVPLPGGGYAFVAANSFAEGKPENGTPAGQYFNITTDSSGNPIATPTAAPTSAESNQTADNAPNVEAPSDGSGTATTTTADNTTSTGGGFNTDAALKAGYNTVLNTILGGVKPGVSTSTGTGTVAGTSTGTGNIAGLSPSLTGIGAAASPTTVAGATPTATQATTPTSQAAAAFPAPLVAGLTKGSAFQFANEPTFNAPETNTNQMAQPDYSSQILNAATGGSVSTALKPTLTQGSAFKFARSPEFSADNFTVQNAPHADYTQQILNAATGGSIHGYAEGQSVFGSDQLPTLQARFLRGRGLSPLGLFQGAQFAEYQPKKFAEGGDVEEHNPEFFSQGGLNSLENTYVRGEGDGTSDSVPAMLANGEFVIPADVVSGLGNGSNDAGAKVLDGFLTTIRAHRQGGSANKLPPDSKGPLAYLLDAKRKTK